VLGELRRFAGVQFDPHLAKEFASIVESSAEDVDVTVLAESTAAEPDRRPRSRAGTFARA
jgi:hypothetical protein